MPEDAAETRVGKCGLHEGCATSTVTRKNSVQQSGAADRRGQVPEGLDIVPYGVSYDDSMIGDDELDRIEARCTAATPGPRKSWVEGCDHTSGDHFISTAREAIYLTGAILSDQDFIAAARLLG